MDHVPTTCFPEAQKKNANVKSQLHNLSSFLHHKLHLSQYRLLQLQQRNSHRPLSALHLFHLRIHNHAFTIVTHRHQHQHQHLFNLLLRLLLQSSQLLVLIVIHLNKLPVSKIVDLHSRSLRTTAAMDAT